MIGIFRSTILTKIAMALSGLIWIGFSIAHLSGHFLLFAGQEAYNAYGQGLKDLGPLLWLGRIIFIISFLLHSFSGILLLSRNKEARPVQYKAKKPIVSTPQSRMMALTGILLFTFMVYHLAHFTWGVVHAEYSHLTYTLSDGRAVHDVYTMVIGSYQNVFVCLAYVLFMLGFGMHLSHAIASVVQTLGFNHPMYNSLVKKVANGLSTIIILGYISIPASVMLGVLKLTGGH